MADNDGWGAAGDGQEVKFNADAAEFNFNVGASEFVPTFSMGDDEPAPAQSGPAGGVLDLSGASKPKAAGGVLDLSGGASKAEEKPVEETTKAVENLKVEEKPAAVEKVSPAPAPAVEEEEAEEEELEEEEVVQGRGKKHINIVFIGHVDAGKSTISGHILYATGMVDDRTLEKFEREAKAKNRESWKYAWALDITDQERAKGKTEECGRAAFETETRQFTILDAPGHKSFVPHMIGGASQADIAVLVISARRGEFETGFEKGGQTREHAVLAKTAGVRTLVVAINKMDDPTVEWNKERYDECCTKLTPFLKASGWNTKSGDDVIFMPVSGLSGQNLKDRVGKDIAPWHDGPSLIELLDTIKQPQAFYDMPLRMPILDKHKDMGSTIIIGKIESGIVKKGQKVLMMPNNAKVEVMGVNLEGEDVSVGEPGDNVRLKIKGIEEEEIKSGYVLCPRTEPVRGCRFFDAKLNILDFQSIMCPGYSSVCHIHACQEEVTLTGLLATLDKKGQVVQKRPKFVKQGQTVVGRFRFARQLCMETFKDFPQLGRFMLRDEGKTIAIGVVTKLHFPEDKKES